MHYLTRDAVDIGAAATWLSLQRDSKFWFVRGGQELPS